MLIRFRRLAAVLLLMPCVVVAGMQRVPDLHVGEVPIESRSDSARAQAMRDALAAVLVKLTGDVSVSLSAAARPLLQSAQSFVSSYRYHDIPPTEPGMPAGIVLRVQFNPNALIRAIKQQGLPIWGERRADTLVWMAGPTPETTRDLLNPAQIQEHYPALAAAAARRGLPMSLPAMDEIDQLGMSYADLVGGYSERVRRASERYLARHVLLIKLIQDGPVWQAEWSMLQEAGEFPRRWRSSGDSPDSAIDGGFDQYADQLAQRYAISVAPGWVQRTRLEIVGIRSLEDYAAAMAYLQDNNLVNSASPALVRAEELHVDLRFEGELEDLQRSIALGGKLEEYPREVPAISPQSGDGEVEPAPGQLSFYALSSQAALRYRWRP